ncbi:choice-of-anchor P family protein [Actinomadura macrotermitis]|uniref:Uncharacterized protein n=1 Tax=Actinomadura macrotermitis TaxID=2585200 RepID=A0A7K0BUS4_9ACTN|nr:choice-of-anchor P family protein [Actinomadura macrotermitis]MQY04893.1 hypothetical protein [Actinomadura macrotermitis]
MRHIKFAQTGLLAVALGLTMAAPAAASPAAGSDAGSGSAFGLAGAGPVPVAPLPAVSSAGDVVSRTLLRENRTQYVNAGALDVKAAREQAHSHVADLTVPLAGLQAESVSATCRQGQGAAHLTQAVVAGKRLDSSPPPNTTIPVKVDGVGNADLVLNKQERMRDGRLNVTAVALDLPVNGKTESLRVASATCGKRRPAHHAKPPAHHAKPPVRPAGEAPKPTPVKGDLPVTG